MELGGSPTLRNTERMQTDKGACSLLIGTMSARSPRSMPAGGQLQPHECVALENSQTLAKGSHSPCSPRGGWMKFSAPTHRDIPYAQNPKTNEAYHASVLHQLDGSDRAKRIREAIAKDPALEEPMMDKEKELKAWWDAEWAKKPKPVASA